MALSLTMKTKKYMSYHAVTMITTESYLHLSRSYMSFEMNGSHPFLWFGKHAAHFSEFSEVLFQSLTVVESPGDFFTDQGHVIFVIHNRQAPG